MKKLLYLAAVLLVTGLAACNNTDKTSDDKVVDDKDYYGEEANPDSKSDGNTGATSKSEPSSTLEGEINPDAEVILDETRESDSLAPADTITYTPTGLGYMVLDEGNGPKPDINSVASVIYTGYHADGSTFDSSNGTPVQFPLYGVIPGFSEGLQLMSKGARYKLYIPGSLGYGTQGIPGVIAPNETLVFDVTLVDFQ